MSMCMYVSVKLLLFDRSRCLFKSLAVDSSSLDVTCYWVDRFECYLLRGCSHSMSLVPLPLFPLSLVDLHSHMCGFPEELFSGFVVDSVLLKHFLLLWDQPKATRWANLCRKDNCIGRKRSKSVSWAVAQCLPLYKHNKSICLVVG